MPWLSAGLEAARMMWDGNDFESCWLSLVVAPGPRVSVATVESRAHRVQLDSSLLVRLGRSDLLILTL